jgi:hypothetical protein
MRKTSLARKQGRRLGGPSRDPMTAKRRFAALSASDRTRTGDLRRDRPAF